MLHVGENRGGPGGQLEGPHFGGPTPLVEAKGGPLVKNVDIVSLKWGLHFPSGLGLLPALHGPVYIC